MVPERERDGIDGQPSEEALERMLREVGPLLRRRAAGARLTLPSWHACGPSWHPRGWLDKSCMSARRVTFGGCDVFT